jgi:phage-related tail protein
MSISSTIQEMKEKISGAKDSIESMDKTVKENGNATRSLPKSYRKFRTQ